MKSYEPYWLEKLQVYSASIVALALIYFLIGPLLAPADPMGAFTTAGTWGIGRFVLFALVVLALAAGAAVVTISARPEAAMLAVVIGAGGLSLRSGSINTALWRHEATLSGLYRGFAAELLALSVLMFACAIVIGLVRRRLGRGHSGWLWLDLHANLTDAERAELGEAAHATSDWLSVEPLLLLRGGEDGKAKKLRRALPAIFGRSLACLGGGAVLAIIILLILMRSGARGQVMFALFFSFLLAVLIVHKMLPTPWLLVAWILPLGVGLAFYVLASTSVMGGEPLAWRSVPLYSLALPIDWVSAGGAGALAGFWASTRVHEVRIIEAEEDKGR